MFIFLQHDLVIELFSSDCWNFLPRRMLKEDRRSEPRVGERVPYVVVYGSPGLPLIQLVRRSVTLKILE